MSDQSQENDEVKTINRKQIMDFSLTVMVLAWVHVVVSFGMFLYNILNKHHKNIDSLVAEKVSTSRTWNWVAWLLSTLVCIAIGVIATWTYLRAKDGRICPLDECVSPIEVV